MRKRWQAERAAKRVRGVHAVVNDIDVKLPMSHERNDERTAAEEAVQHLAGVKGITSRITVKPHVTIDDGRERMWTTSWKSNRSAARERESRRASRE